MKRKRSKKREMPPIKWINLNPNGKIPKGELCPYTLKCSRRHTGPFPGKCKHKGFASKRAFECDWAQVIDFTAKKQP